eukprot:GDKI01027867.1.p2 GENE.GDKI01027867.1~~GDKI01027867.1.p2  ORF type:complete len:138 (-),score=19.38 GDKI01027867.1:225-638(-)
MDSKERAKVKRDNKTALEKMAKLFEGEQCMEARLHIKALSWDCSRDRLQAMRGETNGHMQLADQENKKRCHDPKNTTDDAPEISLASKKIKVALRHTHREWASRSSQVCVCVDPSRPITACMRCNTAPLTLRMWYVA